MAVPSFPGRPWHTQFWPWFLIGLLATSVVVSVAAVVLALHGADPLVSDDWYRRGLAINRDLARAEEAARLGIAATIDIDAENAELVVAFDRANEAPEIEVVLQHPTVAARDRVYRLERRGPATYRGALGVPLAGRWYVSLAPPSGAWRLAAPLTLTSGTAVRLVPES
jgi:hypothetical protein